MTNMKPQMLFAQVGHHRNKPAKNQFLYSVYYVRLPLREDMSKLDTPALFSVSGWNVLSWIARNHGARDGSSVYNWARAQIETQGVTIQDDYSVSLICHPRLFGYTFNPISYYLLEDTKGGLRAVLCEVHNTFGGDHSYVLARDNGEPLAPSDVLEAEKRLYVSPFNTMHGYYKFSFEHTSEQFKSTIDYYKEDALALETFMKGTYKEMNSLRIIGAVFWYPLMTMLVVVRIHWQAIKLWWKKVPATLEINPKNTKRTTSRGR